MRERARTDLRGGRSAMVVPTATLKAMPGGYGVVGSWMWPLHSASWPICDSSETWMVRRNRSQLTAKGE